MYKKTVLSSFILGAVALAGCQQDQPADASQAVNLESNKNQVSYLIGFNTAAQLTDNGIEIDQAAFESGFADAINGADSQLSEEQAEAAFTAYQTEMIAKQEAEFTALATENATASANFLAENAKLEGVSTTDSGLQYKILTAGDGEKPTESSTVRVNYEGRTIKGEVFDSSYQRGEPVEFVLNQVIPGWTEGLQLMPEGSSWELYIPANLAYGEAGAGGLIGPNEALIFKVELLSANVEGTDAE